MLPTLLVHPDPEIRAQLRTFFEPVDFVRIVGEAVHVDEALELLGAIEYAVLVVAVSIKEPRDGFELTRRLRGRTKQPALIFLADNEDDAFTAFELDATDYLIFPCTEERFARSVSRLEQFRMHFNLAQEPSTQWQEPTIRDTSEDIPEEPEQTLQLPLEEEEQDQFLHALRQAWELTEKFRPAEIEKLAITSGGRTMLLPYNEIIFIEANEDYTYVHTASGKHLTSYRLKILEARLRPHNFFRAHRKFLVNLDMVTEIASLPGSNFMLRTAGRTRIEIPISRRRLGELKQVLGL